MTSKTKKPAPVKKPTGLQRDINLLADSVRYLMEMQEKRNEVDRVQLTSARNAIAMATLTGLYSDLAAAMKLASEVIGQNVPLPRALALLAFAQADELLAVSKL